MILLRFLILAISLVFLLRLARRALLLIEPGSPIRKFLLRFYPLLEFGLWLWLVFRGASLGFAQYPYYIVVMSSMSVALVAAAAWYILRDFISGMVLKTENALERGQYIKTELASGKIQYLGFRSMELESDNGEKVRIPYSRLNKLSLARPAEEDSSHSHVIEITVERRKKAELIRKDISGHLINMPWVITGIPPQVKVMVQDEKHFLVEIRFNVLKKDHVIQVEENIRGFSSSL